MRMPSWLVVVLILAMLTLVSLVKTGGAVAMPRSTSVTSRP